MPVYGPYIRFITTTTDATNTTTWKGSILLIVPTQSSSLLVFTEPVLRLWSPGPQPKVDLISGDVLHTQWGHSFYRFKLELPLKKRPQVFCYSFKDDDNNDPNHNHKPLEFHLPAESDHYWRVAFTSCAGWSDATPELKQKMGGERPLWDDMLRHHHHKPYHVMIGGGDQIYCDDVWKLPSLKEWLALKGRDNRLQAPWTTEMDEQVDKFYFESYVQHFANEGMRQAYAQIPQMNVCDDHDVFDGFGSYPDFLEKSHVFQNLRRIGYKYFLLFQHQTTPQADRTGYFLENSASYSSLNQLGEALAVLLVDTRHQRSRERVVHSKEWEIIFDAVERLPTTTRHMIVVFGVPIIYPRLGLVETNLEASGKVKKFTNKAFTTGTKMFASGIGKIAGERAEQTLLHGAESVKQAFGKTGLMKGVLNQFGLVSLEDDLIDHWTNKHHEQERAFVISRLQELSQNQKLRVTFLAGDVHLAAVGKLFNPLQPTDHRLMYQVVSSAIINAPPPAMVIKTVHKSCERQNAKPTKFGNDSVETHEEMLELFQTDVHGHGPPAAGKKLLGRRNWCSIDNLDHPNAANKNELVFSIQVENENYQSESVPYRVSVPPLL